MNRKFFYVMKSLGYAPPKAEAGPFPSRKRAEEHIKLDRNMKAIPSSTVFSVWEMTELEASCYGFKTIMDKGFKQ